MLNIALDKGLFNGYSSHIFINICNSYLTLMRFNYPLAYNENVNCIWGYWALGVAGSFKHLASMGGSDLEVLVVEDDEDDYFLMQEHLSQVGRWVVSLSWAPTFDKAIDHLNHHQPDLLVVDYNLGCNTGLDLVKVLNAAGRHIPSLLVTGQNLDDLGGETEIRRFFDGYLKKAGLTLENLEKALGVILADSA